MEPDVHLRVSTVRDLRSCNRYLSSIAAIASCLALGFDIPQAVRSANRYVEAGIRASRDLGKGSGPINHFHSTYMLPFAP